ncbi:RNA deprotection pyrophosphohydrolase [Peribacillus sp. NPDC097295]|uniref:RNA deprotection pyrophosphohydrolase n=1 Tax=Peribacillus sp. NPDC097295 TaxID=3364402 RepID=UPI0037FD3545
MKSFIDENGYKVEFSHDAAFGEAYHVFVLCRYKGQWVLTKHRKRGMEFPGGKREEGETIEGAAKREVYEETGGLVNELIFLGQYKVYDPIKPFVKSIFFAELSGLERKNDYLETDGPLLLATLPEVVGEEYSFIMRDEILQLSLKRMEEMMDDEYKNRQRDRQ